MKEKIYCKSGGCSAKLGAKKLTHILEKIDKYPNSNLLVGFDSHDDASVIKSMNIKPLFQHLISFHQW